MLKPLLSTNEVADLLSVDKSTLWRWRKQGKLKSYGIGKLVRFKREDIEAFLVELEPSDVAFSGSVNS